MKIKWHYRNKQLSLCSSQPSALRQKKAERGRGPTLLFIRLLPFFFYISMYSLYYSENCHPWRRHKTAALLDNLVLFQQLLIFRFHLCLLTVILFIRINRC